MKIAHDASYRSRKAQIGMRNTYGVHTMMDIAPESARKIRRNCIILAVFHLASVKIGCERVDLRKSILI